MKDGILKYMLDYHRKTKFNFVNLRTLENKFGRETRSALNELFKEGWIAKREGINSPIVELIKFEE